MTATDRGRWKTNVTLTKARAAAQSLQNTKCLSSWLPSEDFRKAGKWGGNLSMGTCGASTGASLGLS